MMIYNTEHYEMFLAVEEIGLKELIHRTQRLPMLALATDLYDICYVAWKTEETLLEAINNEPLLYYPDRRFCELVKAYKRLLVNYSPTEISDTILVKEAGLYVNTNEYESYEISWNKFKVIMKGVFENGRDIQPIFQRLNRY